MYTKKLQLVNMFVHSAFGPPQFADDINRINSRAASDTTGPERWSPANEERFFEDAFRNDTLEGLIRQIATKPELWALVPNPPTPTATAAGENSSPDPNVDPAASASEFFLGLWEEMFQKQLMIIPS